MIPMDKIMTIQAMIQTLLFKIKIMRNQELDKGKINFKELTISNLRMIQIISMVLEIPFIVKYGEKGTLLKDVAIVGTSHINQRKTFLKPWL